MKPICLRAPLCLLCLLLIAAMAISCTKEIRYHIKPATDAKKLGWKYYEPSLARNRKYIVEDHNKNKVIETHARVPQESVVLFFSDSVKKGRIYILTTDTYQVRYKNNGQDTFALMSDLKQTMRNRPDTRVDQLVIKKFYAPIKGTVIGMLGGFLVGLIPFVASLSPDSWMGSAIENENVRLSVGMISIFGFTTLGTFIGCHLDGRPDQDARIFARPDEQYHGDIP